MNTSTAGDSCHPVNSSQSEELGRSWNFADCGTTQLGIYPVVDSVEWIEKLLPLGIKTIQLRIKEQPINLIEEQIAAAIALSNQYDARLFVNDYWQLAIQYQAYGVHLGQEDLIQADLSLLHQANLRLGISTHCQSEVDIATSVNPSYIAIGPVFETTSKDMPFDPQGIEAVKRWVTKLGNRWPLVAIGGIDHERAKLLKQTGVGSVAMISAITEAEDYIRSTQQFLEIWQG